MNQRVFVSVSVSGEGVGKEVEWYQDDLGITIPLEEIIMAAKREFPDVSFSNLTISGFGYHNNIDYSGGDYSKITLGQKDNI